MSDALRIRTGRFGRVALLDMDRSLVRHAHPHCHVLLKIGGADTAFRVGERIAPLTGTTAVLVDGWTPHSYIHFAGSPRTTILALYIEPSWLAGFRSNWASSGRAGFFGSTAGEVTPHISNLAMDLSSSMVHAPAAATEHEALLGELMISVVERFSDWQNVGPARQDATGPESADWRVRKAISIVRRNPAACDNVDRLAAAAGMSRANFFRMFEASTGVTPRVFINMLRLERAVHAAVGSDISFKHLSETLGFSNQAHFTRFFRDHAGVVPSHFRSISRLGDRAGHVGI